MLHLVLDHSALTPCGNKPPEEKAAVYQLANVITALEASWYISARYLKPLASVVTPHWDRMRKTGELGRLPRLIEGLKRTMRMLLSQTRSKARWCKPTPLSKNPSIKLRLHVVHRNAEETLSPSQRQLLDQLGLTGEDREVAALAIQASKLLHGEEVVVTADHKLLAAAEELASHYKVKALKPTAFTETV